MSEDANPEERGWEQEEGLTRMEEEDEKRGIKSSISTGFFSGC